MKLIFPKVPEYFRLLLVLLCSAGMAEVSDDELNKVTEIWSRLITSYEDKSSQVLVPPAIFICREVSFTDPERNMSTLEDFHGNTLDLQYMIWHSWDYMNSSAPDPNSTIFRVEDVYSYSRGRCTTHQWSVEVNRKYILRKDNIIFG